MADNIDLFIESPGAYYPQDFSLKTLNFLTASGQRIEIKKLLVELSYYEDIYSFVASGYITLVDAQGFIELMRLTGNEFIEVNFGKVKDGKNLNDQLFRVYKSSARKPSGNQNSEVYTLYFCSEELLLSEQNKISKSFKGNKISKIVNNILTDKLKVNSSKIDVIEETTGLYDFVIPNMKPFEAISWVSTYARPAAYPGADMLFFETKNGFAFRSLQSMFKDNVYATYKYEAKNIDDKTQSFQEKTITVLDYEISKPFDTLNEINSGTLSNRLISIDPLTRTFKKTDFDYEKFKSQSKSLNANGIQDTLQNRLGKKENESYDGVLKVVIGNSNQKQVSYVKERESGVAQDIFVETYIPNRTAQISLANYTVIKATIPGDPGITAGRTINFNLLSLKPRQERDLDKFYSGKYLVTAVRHIIQSQGVYQTVLEIVKDSTPTAYSSINNNSSNWKAAVNE
jgi:hypothetical protein